MRSDNERIWFRIVLSVAVVSVLIVFACTKNTRPKEDIVIPFSSETKVAEELNDGTKQPSNESSPSVAVITPSAEVTPTPLKKDEVTRPGVYADVHVEVDNIEIYDEPKDGTFRMAFYPRDEPDRIGKRIVRIPNKSEAKVTSICTNLFNEPWYGVTLTIDGKTYNGFVQQSTLNIDGEEPLENPNYEARLIEVPMIENPTGTYGEDRDGDGVYVVVLDPGHGGVFSGATAYGTKEKDIDYFVADACREYLLAHYKNVRVTLTRSGDYVSDTFDADDDLEYRVRGAIERKADMILSMHFNAYNGKSHGVMTLVPRKEDVYEKDLLLASYLMRQIMDDIGVESAGIQRKESQFTLRLDRTPMDGYLMLRLSAEVGMVSCIVEHCYMDAKVDRRFWDTEEKLLAFAEADAKAIAKFLGLQEKE